MSFAAVSVRRFEREVVHHSRDDWSTSRVVDLQDDVGRGTRDRVRSPLMGAEMERFVEFPFPDERFPDELGAVVQRTILDEGQAVRYVGHTHENDWCLSDGVTDPNAPGATVAVHIRHVIDHDPTLEPLASLPVGFQAERDSPNEPWRITPFAWLPDE